MNNQELAKMILENVGGEGNISFATFCMTRLRLTIKDKGLIDNEKIEKTEGIIGTKYLGNQYQIIIGPEVENVYKEFCKIANIDQNKGVDEVISEDLIKHKEKTTFKSVLNQIMDTIGACITPVLPIITAAGLLKMLVALLGPSMLNVFSETSDIIRLFTFAGDAGFYFFPFYIAYASAKRFGTNIPLALFLAGIIMHPILASIVAEGESFSIYGIPMTLTNYSNSFVPMILSTLVMSYVEKALNKYIPKSLKALLLPLLLIMIMLPITLCVLGPLGTILGEGVAKLIVILHDTLGPVSIGIMGALWPLLIATGMHQALNAVAINHITTTGMDASILVGPCISAYVMMGIGLAFLLKGKNAEEKASRSGSFITLALGGISEPTIFGIILKYKKAILYLFAGGFAGGLYAGLMNVAVYFFGSGNFLVALMFTGENTNSFPQGVIASVIGFAVAFILAIIFGFESNEKKLKG